MGKKNNGKTLIIIAVIIFAIMFLASLGDNEDFTIDFGNDNKTLNILASYENKQFEDDIIKFAKDNNFKVKTKYMGDLDIVAELNTNSSEYDAVWISNSVWLYSLDNSYLTSDSKSLSISPVVMGVRKSKAQSLDLIDKDLTNADILDLISSKKISYVMSSVTQTNSGATAYLGFLNALAGSPEVLTEEMLDDESLANKMIDLFSGVKRVSGDEEYLERMFINDKSYEAIIASESSLIRINDELKKLGQEELYLLYPVDGVPINDSTLAFIKNNEKKEDYFLNLQSYLLSKDGQKLLSKKGYRTWYGGVSTEADKNVFNPKWGIDTTKYLITSKYPSKAVMDKAINLYIEELRKPTHVVFVLDYSGSMAGSGKEELSEAMSYILDHDQASQDKLQFSKKDKITVITFASNVEDIWSTDNGLETQSLINNIQYKSPLGATALYDAIIKGLDILSTESDQYTKTVIAMTDGEVNRGTYFSLQNKYNSLEEKVPVYSITFGQASESQLRDIAALTNAKVFNGKSGLLRAFQEVRGYN